MPGLLNGNNCLCSRGQSQMTHYQMSTLKGAEYLTSLSLSSSLFYVPVTVSSLQAASVASIPFIATASSLRSSSARSLAAAASSLAAAASCLAAAMSAREAVRSAAYSRACSLAAAASSCAATTSAVDSFEISLHCRQACAGRRERKSALLVGRWTYCCFSVATRY